MTAAGSGAGTLGVDVAAGAEIVARALLRNVTQQAAVFRTVGQEQLPGLSRRDRARPCRSLPPRRGIPSTSRRRPSPAACRRGVDAGAADRTGAWRAVPRLRASTQVRARPHVQVPHRSTASPPARSALPPRRSRRPARNAPRMRLPVQAVLGVPGSPHRRRVMAPHLSQPRSALPSGPASAVGRTHPSQPLAPVYRVDLVRRGSRPDVLAAATPAIAIRRNPVRARRPSAA